MPCWQDKYDHVPKSNGTFCRICGRYCKRKTTIGYREKEMYKVYTISVAFTGTLYWKFEMYVCPECKDKLLAKRWASRKLIRKIYDNSPFPTIKVQQKCNIG